MSNIYPDAKKGSLAEDHSSYAVGKKPKGPGTGNMQSKAIVAGVILVIIFGSLMVVAFVGAFKNSSL